MGQEGPTDVTVTASRRRSCAGRDGKSRAYHRRGRGRGYILPDHRRFGPVFYFSSQPYLRATCFPPDEPKDNGDGEPVRYQAQNTSSVLFFC